MLLDTSVPACPTSNAVFGLIISAKEKKRSLKPQTSMLEINLWDFFFFLLLLQFVVNIYLNKLAWFFIYIFSGPIIKHSQQFTGTCSGYVTNIDTSGHRGWIPVSMKTT